MKRKISWEIKTWKKGRVEKINISATIVSCTFSPLVSFFSFQQRVREKSSMEEEDRERKRAKMLWTKRGELLEWEFSSFLRYVSCVDSFLILLPLFLNTHSFSVLFSSTLSLFFRRFFFQLHHQPSSPKSWELRNERGSKGRIRIKNSHSCFTRGKSKRRKVEEEKRKKKRERRMQGKQRTKKNLSFLPSSKKPLFHESDSTCISLSLSLPSSLISGNWFTQYSILVSDSCGSRQETRTRRKFFDTPQNSPSSRTFLRVRAQFERENNHLISNQLITPILEPIPIKLQSKTAMNDVTPFWKVNRYDWKWDCCEEVIHKRKKKVNRKVSNSTSFSLLLHQSNSKMCIYVSQEGSHIVTFKWKEGMMNVPWTIWMLQSQVSSFPFHPSIFPSHHKEKKMNWGKRNFSVKMSRRNQDTLNRSGELFTSNRGWMNKERNKKRRTWKRERRT